jgi:molybdopterin-dependent oxidoreductase alpha subunit
MSDKADSNTPSGGENPIIGHVHESRDTEHGEDIGPEKSVSGAEPPADRAEIKPERRERIAAGLPAIWETFRYVWGNMGVWRGSKSLIEVNKEHGFDCQSCAWPSPDHHRKIAEFCENGAKAIADEGTRARVSPDFFKQHSIKQLLEQSDHWLNKQGRLTHPMLLCLGGTHYEPIGWDAAFRLLAEKLKDLASPNQTAFYTSGKLTNEPAYLFQLFAREFGTNNLPDCSNMCHESSGTALKKAIGIGKGTVTLDDFLHTDLIFVVGQNPGTNHPRMLSSLEAAKKRGAKIISVNPLPETGNFRFRDPQHYKSPLLAVPTQLGHGVAISDLWVPIRINGDLAFFQGVMKEMLAEELAHPGTVFDHTFIREFTTGYEELIANLNASSWEDILQATALTRSIIRQVAEMAIHSKATICCWAMGLTQHKNAVSTIGEVLNFLLLRGNIGRPGAGPCCVRGHSNVQGDRTMGIWERVMPEFLDKLEKRYSFKPPREKGSDTVDSIKAMHRGDIKILVSMGGNLLSAGPDTNFTAEAMQACELTAFVATKLNRGHLITGKTSLLLPCLGRNEIDRKSDGSPQFTTVEDSMGIVNPSRGLLRPASSDLLSETAIIGRLAEAVLGSRSKIPWDRWVADFDLIRDEIAEVVPGFERFNERIKKGIFYLPNPPRDLREFQTDSRRAAFHAFPLTAFTVPQGEYILTTIRSHDQFNTTIYGLNDRYRGIFNGRRVVFMNADDIEAERFTAGQPIDLIGRFGDRERIAHCFLVTPYQIPRGCLATYFPEANVLVPISSVADESNQPTSKSVRVRVRASDDPEQIGRKLRVEASV